VLPCLLCVATPPDDWGSGPGSTRFADLDLGFVDGAVMALAERMRVPILTFDFGHFRATRPARGLWHLVVDEPRYAEAT
jgi:hypothetical protein